MFIAKVSAATKASWRATNLAAAEHSAWKWVPLSQLDGLAAEGKLHPVVKKLVGHHKAELLKAAGLQAGG